MAPTRFIYLSHAGEFTKSFIVVRRKERDSFRFIVKSLRNFPPKTNRFFNVSLRRTQFCGLVCSRGDGKSSKKENRCERESIKWRNFLPFFLWMKKKLSQSEGIFHGLAQFVWNNWSDSWNSSLDVACHFLTYFKCFRLRQSKYF